MNLPFWDIPVAGDTVGTITGALALFVGLALVFNLLRAHLLGRAEKLASRTKSDADDAFLAAIRSIRPPFYLFLSFYLALRVLSTAEGIMQVVDTVLIVWVTYQTAIFVRTFIDHLAKHLKGGGSRSETSAALDLLGRIGKGVVWVIGALFVLSNLGIKITSLLAGLGIGGVAVALAAQNLLGDLFAAFAIYFDKPFMVGDFIIVGDKMGTVEKIGVKTTRIRSLSGEEIAMSNSHLVNAEIQNYKRMQKRRAVITFGVVYGTPADKLRRIPELAKRAVESAELTTFDRGFFSKFDDSSVSFELVYYLDSADYNVYTEQNQAIAFTLKELLEKEGIEMAFPTRTVYLHTPTP